ncbi:MAG: DUF1330 domain-containing protein [Rhodobacteraceae bacterium]|jgi:uncharacterized protein (DUF1330 family)|nr:hypothetical protein [Paracoccaceae bacterium]MBC8409078.1 DUF1330 domain-containing protein [Paracoccaceae bacterium]MBT4284977.1 DUF1330 domain-containing protein [Paracoccaceae bacterium]MBT4777273.1 DUF1330 domain-containing protein [Paracoccaceae bacterium]MBT6271578.1 DUF1330 domain-containing protein [Paracoccaceae bacterium]|tara:strand:+ start:3508 stop:3795 length:288 start_codon:yes stop_codon:yes gene_type:complete
MSAYWIGNVKVTDEEAYGKYAAIATVAIAEHGGKFLARGGKYEQLEGNDRSRNVLAKFPSLEAAHNCYYSERYQEAVSHAKGACERDLVIVEGSD